MLLELKVGRFHVESILEIIPKTDFGERRFDGRVELGFAEILALAVQAFSENHVFVD